MGAEGSRGDRGGQDHEEDGRVVTTVSINAGGVEPILKKILFKERKKKKKKRFFSGVLIYTEFVSSFPRREIKHLRGSLCEQSMGFGVRKLSSTFVDGPYNTLPLGSERSKDDIDKAPSTQ